MGCGQEARCPLIGSELGRRARPHVPIGIGTQVELVHHEPLRKISHRLSSQRLMASQPIAWAPPARCRFLFVSGRSRCSTLREKLANSTAARPDGSQQKRQTACAASTTSLGGKQVAQFASRLAITLITIVKLHAHLSPCVGFFSERPGLHCRCRMPLNQRHLYVGGLHHRNLLIAPANLLSHAQGVPTHTEPH